MAAGSGPLPEVGVAIDQPALRESVNRALARSKRYSAARLDRGAVQAQTATYAAVVTTLASLRTRVLDLARRRSAGCPIVVVLSEHEHVEDSTALDSADAFVSERKIGTLLPAAIVLSAFRLSAIPARFAPRAAVRWE